MPFKKGNQHGRKSTRVSLNLSRTPRSRVEPDASEDEMADDDVDGDVDVTGDGTPQQQDDEEDEAEVATPPAEEEDDDDDDDAPRITSMPRRRGRPGRPRTRPGYSRTPDQNAEEGSESGTPMKRKRGRPPGSGAGRGRGGFRGRRKGQAAEGPKTVMDKEGNVYDVVDDEALVDDDPEGNDKVDELGQLQGGREYRVRTFTIMGKGERLYMLSTEPARCCGFRDSYLFFTKHPKLYKVLISDDQKMDLIEREILPNSYKGRNIGVVTARSVFREFGARIIVGGRKVIDDYKVQHARANGEPEGELADPDDYVPDKRSEYNRNRYVAWFGASEVYRTSGAATVPGAKQNVVRKHRNNITVQNWQFMHAREANRFNSTLAAARQANQNGVYDPNTNMMFYPKIMQPTHAKWEHVPSGSDGHEKEPTTNGLTNGHHVNGTSEMDIDPSPQSTLFTRVPPVISRNFTIVDTHYVAPPISNAGYPGPDGHVEDPTSGPNGLSTVSQDLIDELPPSCRMAFEEARAAELGWKRRWSTEANSGQRGYLKIGFNGYPV